MKTVLLLLAVVMARLSAELVLDEKPKQTYDHALVLGSKTSLSQYAIEEMDFVFEYNLFNIGEKTALKVTLDDRHSFPTQAFEVVKGMLQVRWEKIAPGANVTHSVVVRPRSFGTFNHTAAQITYYPKEDAKEVRVGYTTAPGEGHIYRRLDYDRRYASKWSSWLVFFFLALPSTALPFAIWWNLRNLYPETNDNTNVEKTERKKKN